VRKLVDELRRAFGAGDAAAFREHCGELLGSLEELEHSLLQGAEKAQTYLDAAGVILLAIGADGKVSYINRRGCEILEVPESEVLGRDRELRRDPARRVAAGADGGPHVAGGPRVRLGPLEGRALLHAFAKATAGKHAAQESVDLGHRRPK
jgi:PAS domain-containing protein